jgi:hypothetical protein
MWRQPQENTHLKAMCFTILFALLITPADCPFFLSIVPTKNGIYYRCEALMFHYAENVKQKFITFYSAIWNFPRNGNFQNPKFSSHILKKLPGL